MTKAEKLAVFINGEERCNFSNS